MYPVIYDFGAITISSFGVMMVIAFLLGNYLLRKDVVAEGYEPIVAEDITFRAAIGGILGAKIYYLISLRYELFRYCNCSSAFIWLSKRVFKWFNKRNYRVIILNYWYLCGG